MKKTASFVCCLFLAVGVVAAQDKKAAKGKAGDPAKGKETFEQCAACHSADTAEKKVGPSLMGLFKKAKLHSGKALNEANVKAVINAGGNGMPPYADLLSDAEKADLMAYLKTL
jgi:mono/diheme cytochrome c family protein